MNIKTGSAGKLKSWVAKSIREGVGRNMHNYTEWSAYNNLPAMSLLNSMSHNVDYMNKRSSPMHLWSKQRKMGETNVNDVITARKRAAKINLSRSLTFYNKEDYRNAVKVHATRTVDRDGLCGRTLEVSDINRGRLRITSYQGFYSLEVLNSDGCYASVDSVDRTADFEATDFPIFLHVRGVGQILMTGELSEIDNLIDNIVLTPNFDQELSIVGVSEV